MRFGFSDIKEPLTTLIGSLNYERKISIFFKNGDNGQKTLRF